MSAKLCTLPWRERSLRRISITKSVRLYTTAKAKAKVPHITLYTGTNCSLCDVVKETLQAAQKECANFTLAMYNIRDNSLPDVQRWRRAYQYDIPVVHLNGTEIARHRLPKDVLLARLKELEFST